MVGWMRKLIFVFLLINLQLFAGNTGRISGQVLTENNTPLAFANVQIFSQNLGAIADEDGYYMIYNIPPGKYEVICSIVGYNNHIIKDVRVSSDETSVVTFHLEKNPVNVDGVVVQESRNKLVDHMKISTGLAVSESKIEKINVQDVDDIIELQAGSTIIDGKLHVRGGRVNEVVYIIDGVWVNDPVDASKAISVDVDAIKEIKLMSGGFPAEYGNAQSGIINITTKKGTNQFSGKIEYESDHLTNGFHTNSDKYKFVLSGPLFPAANNKLFFFANATIYTHDSQFKNDFGNDPNDEIPELDIYWQNRDFYDPYKNRNSFMGIDWNEKLNNYYHYNLKLNYQFSPLCELVFSMRGNKDHEQPYDHSWRYALNHYIEENLTQNFYNLTFKKMYQSRVSLNLRAGFYMKKYSKNPLGVKMDDFFTLRDKNGLYEHTSAFADCDGIDYFAQNGIIGEQISAYYWEFFSHYYGTFIPITNFKNPNSVYEEIENNKNTTLSFASDVGWNINRHHYLQSGFEVISHHLKRSKTTSPWEIYELRYYDYLQHNCTPVETIYNDVLGIYQYYYTGQDIFDATYAAAGESYGLIANSQQFGFFIQDTIEREGMVVNLGIRADGWYLGDSYDIFGNDKTYSTVVIENNNRFHLYFSPRLGISYAISEKDVMHFSHSYQSQIPQLQYVYANSTWIEAINSADQKTHIILGNQALDPQTTIASQIGIQHQFNEYFLMDLSVYNKKSYNYISIEKFINPDEPMIQYYQYISEHYGTAQGVDINLMKNMSHFFYGSLFYSLAWAKGSDAKINDYIDQDSESLREFPLDWDVRHSFGCNFTFLVQEKEELSLFFTNYRLPLDNFSINVSYEINSGLPYTVYDENMETNNKRKPYTDILNLKFSKNFRLSTSHQIKLSCTIDNVFDKENVEFAYLNTGSASDDGTDFPDPDAQSIHELFTSDPDNISSGRSVTFGIGYSW